MAISKKAQQAIIDNIAELRKLDSNGLKAWAKDHKISWSKRFPQNKWAFESALKDHGIDRDALKRNEAYRAELEAQEAAAASDNPLVRAVGRISSARLWEKNGHCRIYLDYQRGTDVWIEVEVIDGRVEDLHARCFVSTRQHWNWIQSQKARATEYAERQFPTLAAEIFADRHPDELTDRQREWLAAADAEMADA